MASPPRNTIGVPTLNIQKKMLPRLDDAQATQAVQELQRQLDEQRRQTEFWMQRLGESIDTAQGFRGAPTYHADVDANSKRLTKLGVPKDDTDAQIKGLALSRATTDTKFWDARGLPILNLPKDIAASQADATLTQEQIRALIAAELRDLKDTLIAEPYVTVSSSALLTAERTLAIENGVLTLTDGGANSSLTVAVAANGISDAKLRQGAATSVMGVTGNAISNEADITATSDGQILGRYGTSLSFSATPNIATSVTVPLVSGGTAAGSLLTLKSTSGVGTTDAIIFQVGNNGATEAMRILDSGNVGIGTTAPLRLLHVNGRHQLGGTAIATTDWTLTAGWGANAIISAVTGTDSRGTVTVQTSALDTPGLNPVLTLTFKDGTWSTTPFTVATLNRLGTGLTGAVECNATATTLVLEYIGTPTALTAETYIFNYHVLG